MRTEIHERKTTTGYQVRVFMGESENSPAQAVAIAEKVVEWFDERGIDLEVRQDIDMHGNIHPVRYMRGLNPSTFLPFIVLYVPKFEADDRMVFQLTFGGNT